MKKIFLLILILISFSLWVVYPTWAQKSNSEEATPSQAIKEKIKERLEKNATESAEQKEEDSQTANYFAWVGTLKKVDEDTLFITTDEGEREALVDKKTVILQTEKGKSRKEVKAEDLKLDNFIIAMGLKEDERIKALRVLVTPPETLPEPEVVFGKVSEVEDERIRLVNGEETVLPITAKTPIKVKGSSKENKLSDIQLEDRLFAVVVKKGDKIDLTRSLFVLPGKNNPQATLKPSAEATVSATATPSATPKTQKSPSPIPEEE